MTFALPDPSTPFGARVARRLVEERVIWLTTTGADGTPQPNPVWFLWEGASFLMYSLSHAARVRHIQRVPRASVHFDGNSKGGDIIIFTGAIAVASDAPSADQNPAYIERYRERIDLSHGGPEKFAARYSLPLRLTPDKIRGF